MKPAVSIQKANDASSRWSQLDSNRRGMIHRIERYAQVTIPKVCLPDHVQQNSTSLQHDWTSVGAQCVNHVVNKIMMSLFQPGLPFFRLDTDEGFQLPQGVTEEKLRGALVAGEARAVRILDQRAVRPYLNETLKHLVVAGNVCLDLTDDTKPRVIGIKRHCVKRSLTGKLIEGVIAEKVLFDELDDKAQEALPNLQKKQSQNCQQYVTHYRWFKKRGSKWTMTQWVDQTKLPDEFTKVWTEDRFPVHFLTWDLSDDMDYGTGLVEDYAGDFGTLSTLSEAEIKAAILASDYRWLADPAGVGDINEYKLSTTGEVLAGRKDDLTLVAHVSTQALSQIRESVGVVINRLGRGFLLSSAVTRDAERVTAEEIRMQANELETSLGGVYSRLAVDLQLPLARWLLRLNGVEVGGTKLIPTIVTGLAALSRNAEAQQLLLFIQQVAQIGALPPPVLQRLKLGPIISKIAAAFGLSADDYVFTEEEARQFVQEAQSQQNEAVAQQELSKQGAAALADKATQQ